MKKVMELTRLHEDNADGSCFDESESGAVIFVFRRSRTKLNQIGILSGDGVHQMMLPANDSYK